MIRQFFSKINPTVVHRCISSHETLNINLATIIFTNPEMVVEDVELKLQRQKTCSAATQRQRQYTCLNTHNHPPVHPSFAWIMLFISSLISFAEMMSWKHERNSANWGGIHSILPISVLLSHCLSHYLFLIPFFFSVLFSCWLIHFLAFFNNIFNIVLPL